MENNVTTPEPPEMTSDIQEHQDAMENTESQILNQGSASSGHA